MVIEMPARSDVCALDGCRSYGLNRQCGRFFGSGWELNVGEHDSKCAHCSGILALEPVPVSLAYPVSCILTYLPTVTNALS